MSLCDKCMNAADYKRMYFDVEFAPIISHPINCGCPCQHREPEQWEKQFSTEQPGD